MSHRPPPTHRDAGTRVRADLAAPVSAGVVAALVGYGSSFVVVLAGLAAVGATPAQATSGLLALCLAQAAGMVLLCLRHRSPLSLAWSTPGAALLLSTGTVVGGWPAAVGAFVATGVLVALTGLVPVLGRAVAAIPVPLAQAMLAGVLLPICAEPVRALAEQPVAVAPVVLAWLVALRWWPRWAAPSAIAAAVVVVVATSLGELASTSLLPAPTLTAPTWSLPALVGIALPLYVVTMASQNVPGVAVMRSVGYEVPWRETMTLTGLATVLVAPLGGHAVNLAAITAALAAGPDAGPDRSRRWIAGISAAATYVVLGIGTAALGAVVAAASPGVVEAAAGLALLGTLTAALAGSLAAEADRVPVAVCLLVAASGTVVLGIGPAFWALVAGLAVRLVVARAPLGAR